MNVSVFIATSSVLSDVGLGFTAFFAGALVSAGYFIYWRTTAGNVVAPENEAPTQTPINDAARTSMAVQHIRDLARNVASDVGAHNTLVGGFSEQLEAIQESDCNHGQVVKALVGQMLKANSTLQGQLEDAERKIQTQADEIRAQQSEARTDALTNLPNRRAFDQCLSHNVQHLEQHARPFSLLIFDIDHFKQFNDTYGHLAGDEVLRAVGRTMGRIIKEGDLAARYGGEEFAVLMQGCRVDAAQVMGERVRCAIEGMAIEFEGQTLRVTASIGVAECESGEKELQLIRRADDGVYASKKAGRNCSHWHNGTICLPVNVPGKRRAQVRDASTGATVNPITGANFCAASLPDGDAFAEILKCRIAERQRTGIPLSVLRFGVKNLDATENRYGNAVVELLCESLATNIASMLREVDLLGRLANGQFVVMLPGNTENAAKIVGQRVKAAISSCPISVGDSEFHLELELRAVGVGPDDDAATVMKRVESVGQETLSIRRNPSLSY